jgi:hypothetical protein
MTDERPHDWEWVKAIGTCQATVVFGELKSLVKRDVSTRNQQLGREQFSFVEVDGIQFAVGRSGHIESRIFFAVTENLKEITICRLNSDEIGRYTVRLDENGQCRLFSGESKLDHWQVLQAALEPLLFEVPRRFTP